MGTLVRAASERSVTPPAGRHDNTPATTRRQSGWLDLPLGLSVPDECDASRILAALPGTPQPAWWAGSVHLRNVTVVVSLAAVSLNSQAMGILRGVEAGAGPLLVIAPLFAHEGFATLLVNDALRAVPGNLVLMRTLVSDHQVAETISQVGALLGVLPWDGRPENLATAPMAELEATAASARFRLHGRRRLSWQRLAPWGWRWPA